MTAHIPQAAIERAIFDPGEFLPRERNEVTYETLTRWQARAVCAVVAGSIAKAIADEQERCARVALELKASILLSEEGRLIAYDHANRIAASIRGVTS